MEPSFSWAAATNFSGGTSTPRSTTSNPPPSASTHEVLADVVQVALDGADHHPAGRLDARFANSAA